MIRTKWLNVIVFALILAYQIAFLALPVFSDVKNPVSFADGMTLLSSIGIILAMFSFSLAIRRAKQTKEAPELPKIKDPVVITPEQPAAPEESKATADETGENECEHTSAEETGTEPEEHEETQLTDEIPAQEINEKGENTQL